MVIRGEKGMGEASSTVLRALQCTFVVREAAQYTYIKLKAVQYSSD